MYHAPSVILSCSRASIDVQNNFADCLSETAFLSGVHREDLQQSLGPLIKDLIQLGFLSSDAGLSRKIS